jgi:hypothetical protein
MSTSHIPVYYDNHLVGSITLAEFMNQPRFGGRSLIQLMSLRKKDLHIIYLEEDPLKREAPRPKSRMTKNDLLMSILWANWLNSHPGRVEWEAAAIMEIQRTYLRLA